MSRRRHTRRTQALTRLSLAALLLGLPMPAVAEDGAPAAAASDLHLAEASAPAGFSLRLAKILAVEGPSLHLEGSAAADRLASEADGTSEILLTGFREAHPLARQAAEEVLAQQAAPKKKGAGRWLKRHWYVPVLAAVAVGVAIDASGGDSDAGGEED